MSLLFRGSGKPTEAAQPQDLISSKSKGGIGAPWAEDRDRPVAGIDIAEKGATDGHALVPLDHV